MAYEVLQLLKMSQAQLDELFTKSAPGEIPNGEAHGTAIVAPGTTYTAQIATFINHFAWQGKVFDAQKGEQLHRALQIGKEDGHLLALTLQGRPRGEDLLGEV